MHSAKTEPHIHCADGSQNWHALFTRHQHENTVARSLSSKGHDVYLPLYCSVHRWQDRAKELWLPLFPCYVFVHGGMDRQMQILTTPGMIHIVGWGGHPAVVPQAQLDAVRQILESTLHVEPHAFLRTGDRVRVTSGPLLGLEGVLTRTKGAARLVVSMEMLGRSAAVEIDASQVERTGPFRVRELANPTSASA